jgi:hypothetical protein
MDHRKIENVKTKTYHIKGRTLDGIFSVRKPERKTPLVRRRRKLGDNTEEDFKEMACDEVDYTHLAQSRASGVFLWTR